MKKVAGAEAAHDDKWARAVRRDEQNRPVSHMASQRKHFLSNGSTGN